MYNTRAKHERLSDFHMFKDTGCQVHPACLTCPLPRCRYDEPGWQQREERDLRDSEVLRMRMKHALSVGQLAAEFGISTRTVLRILQKRRQLAGPAVRAGRRRLLSA